VIDLTSPEDVSDGAPLVDDLAERRTARLRLRRPVSSDLSWLTALYSDPRNYPHAPGGAHNAERARVKAAADVSDWEALGIGYWLVEQAGQPLGMLGVRPMPLAGRPAWNLYYRFMASARGRGFASESGREALAVAAALDPRRPVVVRTRPDNDPARRLAVTLGLQRRPELDAGDGFVVYASSW
jgi:RimJ/RimL family protein N-acetyltransferase